MEWIKAKHAKPTAEVFFLVVMDEVVNIAVWIPYEQMWYLDDGTAAKHEIDITHFAPLPEVPKNAR
jgi:hypothetical protein